MKKLFLAAFILTSLCFAGPKKVLIFYSSMGNGHISAAKSVQEQVLIQEPESEIVLKDIREFMGTEKQEQRNRKIFLFIAQNFKGLFDSLFRGKMEKGNRVPTLNDVDQTYNLVELEEFIRTTEPDSILSTHYGAAQAMVQLREQNKILDTKVAWLHTDYFEGYFPRISQGIEKTYLAHPALEKVFLERGVAHHRLDVSGMPFNAASVADFNKQSFLKEEGINPDHNLITISSGGDGFGDFEEMVKQIARKAKKPTVIVAITARNEKQLKKLEKLKSKLPDNVTLIAHGFVEQKKLLSYSLASHVYITKSGGLSPSEAFFLNRPTILLDIMGGHEVDNAKFFEDLGLAIVNRDYRDLGNQVNELLTNQSLVDEMLRFQQGFANTLAVDRIANFLTSDETSPAPSVKIGIENGVEASFFSRKIALDKLERAAPADIELLLSFATHRTDNYLDGENPFGHLAIRIGDQVITAAHKAVPGEDEQLLKTMSLDEYLYQLNKRDPNELITSSFGQLYGRDIISLRVKGIPNELLRKGLRYVDEVNQKFHRGQSIWHLTDCNCVNHTIYLLEEMGLGMKAINPKQSLRHQMPLDVFEAYLDYFQRRSDVRSEVVHYQRMKHVQGPFRFSKFPVSLYQIKRSMKKLYLQWKGKREWDKLYDLVGKRIASYPKNLDVNFENINGRVHGQEIDEFMIHTQRNNLKYAEIVDIEKQLQVLQTELEKTGGIINGDDLESNLKTHAEIQNLMDLHSFKQFDYIASVVISFTGFTSDKIMPRLKPSQRKKLQKYITQIDDLYEEFIKNQHLYGTGKDYKRVFAFRKMLRVAKSFYDEINTLEKRVSRTDRVVLYHRLQGLKFSMQGVYNRISKYMSALPAIGSLLRNFTFIEKNIKGEQSRIMQAFNTIFCTVGEYCGYKVEFDGLENMPKETGDKVLNIYTPTHRHPILDNAMVANLGIDKAYIFAAVNQFSPNQAVANRLAKAEALVEVGGDSNPIQEVLTGLTTNPDAPNDILIFPEGGVSTLNESRPIRDKFSSGLLRILKRKGYKLNIIPITFLNNSTFMTETLPGNGKLLKGIVHPAIPSNVVDEFLSDRKEGPTKLARLIRGHWLEAMGTNDELIFGNMRTDSLHKELLNYLNIDSHNVLINPRSDCHILIESLMKGTLH